jgi:hypothetical protein
LAASADGAALFFYNRAVPGTVPNSEETVMIATPRPRRVRLTLRHQQLFVCMLPTITKVARQAFASLDAEAQEEAVAEVIAASFAMFVQLVERGREALAYASVLALYGVKRVKIGRMTATKQNVQDVSSKYCQLQKRLTIERLDQFDREDDAWKELVVEDRHAGPSEVAAARIDIGDWLKSLPRRTRRIATTLATGEATGKTAKRFGVSAGRISQMRRELMESWEEFVGETLAGSDANHAVALPA